MEAIIILLGTMNLIMTALLLGTFSKLSSDLEDISNALALLYNELLIKKK